MRIISGKFRKKNIIPPKNFKARPTTDMAKESLFNILENTYEFEALKILDLFSGTGSISYEFASRGCLDITSVELNFKHYAFVKKTVENLGIQEQVKVIRKDAFVFIKKTNKDYDLIFADPPYDLENLQNIPKKIFENNLLKSGGILVFEHSDKFDFRKNPYFSFNKKYGSVNFSFFEFKTS